MKKIIINADDFGMSEAFNHGVIKSYRDGIVSAVSLMSNLPAAEHAIMLAKDYPEMCISQHTNFVLGRPCANPAKIPHLVDENGYFYRSGEYRSGRRGFIYEEVKTETLSQLERFKELTGHYPEHLEGHAVKSEEISQAFWDIAKELGIHTSFVPETLKGSQLPGYKKVAKISSSKRNEIASKGYTVENFLNDDLDILKSSDDILELHTHPGYVDQFILDNSTLTTPRCRDLQTLCDPRVREWFKANDIEIISFFDIIEK